MNVVLVTGYGGGTLPPVGEDNLVNGIMASLFDFSQSTKRLQVCRQPGAAGKRACLVRLRANCSSLFGARRKANSETDHDRWAFPIVFSASINPVEALERLP